MAKILFTTFGSYGDIHPYLAIGVELRNRGHLVTVATSETYRAKVISAGLAFHTTRPDMKVADREMTEYFFDAKRGSERVIRFISSVARESFADTLPAIENADLVVTQIMSLAAIAGAQRLKKRWVSTVLAPSSLLSTNNPPLLPQAPWLVHFRVFGPGVMQRLFSVGKRQSRAWLEDLLSLRESLGLSNEEHPFFEGANSPTRVLGLFSRHLMAKPRDWPTQMRVTGFPFFDEPESTRELDSFLRAGPPPVLFTLGSSAVHAAGDFYRVSLQVAAQLQLRAILLTGSLPQDLPKHLAAGVIATSYVPFAQILPKCAAVVHQGGIGTTAQAMRAGCPMLVVPFAHDQFDNAERVRHLGVAEVAPRSSFTASRAAGKLHRLLTVPAYSRSADALAAQVRKEQGADAAANEIEAVLKESP